MTAASLPAAAPRVLVVDVDGMVHPVTVEILSRAIQQAKQENAALVLVRLNTPGGLMDAMRESIEKIVGAPMPVVTFVTPSGARAASAGFFAEADGGTADDDDGNGLVCEATSALVSSGDVVDDLASSPPDWLNQ